MMHVFHIKGLSGLMFLVLAVVAALLLALLLPASFMMVLWNALVYEGLGGAEINISQGLLLWAITAVLIKVVLRPEIQFQFQSGASHGKSDKKALPVEETQDVSAPTVMEEPSSTLEK